MGVLYRVVEAAYELSFITLPSAARGIPLAEWQLDGRLELIQEALNGDSTRTVDNEATEAFLASVALSDGSGRYVVRPSPTASFVVFTYAGEQIKIKGMLMAVPVDAHAPGAPANGGGGAVRQAALAGEQLVVQLDVLALEEEEG